MSDQAPDTPARGHASGYSVVYNAQRGRWIWTAYHGGSSRVGSSIAKLDAEWQARDAWDRLDRDPNG